MSGGTAALSYMVGSMAKASAIIDVIRDMNSSFS
jgi:hypothetical protein